MQEIDINRALFTQLKEDYNHQKKNNFYQAQLQSGFDYMEAMIKLFGVVSISVLKNIDEALYKEIFTKNFKLAPSLGDFKSLATAPFSKKSKKTLSQTDELYMFLETLMSKKLQLKLSNINELMEGVDKQNSYSSLTNLLNDYAVGFRNKLKGHGASFRDEDSTLRELTLSNLDKLLSTLEDAYNELAKEVEFFLVEGSRLAIKYKGVECQLLPILSYIECHKFSCEKEHKTKLFFYNDGKENKSHYIDYSYNHFHQVTQKNEIHNSLTKLQEEVLHTTSDYQRETLLLSNFVGREKELQTTKEHIFKAMESQQASFFSVMGKPGIGKSAFLTQLQQIMREDEELKDSFNSYTFYAQKDKMGSTTEEQKHLYNHLSKYFDEHGIHIKKEENELFHLRDSLEKIFHAYEESSTTKPLLLIIDGLDEFANPSQMIQNIPLNIFSKIHLIFSSRPYKKIRERLSSVVATSEQLLVLNKESVIKSGYSFELGKLLIGEVEELLSQVLSKDIPRESQEYIDIVETIAKQTESLPLYIYYITQQLKEYDVTSDKDIALEIKKFAKKLPPKLSEFYTKQFQSITPLSRNILYLLFLSHSSVSKEEFYTLLQSVKENEFLLKDIDEVVFTELHFNTIEVFLDVDNEGKYNFYHLSVKEQLIEHLKELGQCFSFDKESLSKVLLDGVVEHYSEYIEKILYIKKDSDIYNLLDSLTQKVTNSSTPTYYTNNYFHLLNTFTWANIYIAQINHEDMLYKEYSSLTQMQELTETNREEILNFFQLFEQKERKHLFEIEYAYRLAFLAQEYREVLHYKDLYENFVQDMFLEIVINVDKVEYIDKFIQHKYEWLNSVNEEVKEFFLKIIRAKKRVDATFIDVMEFLDNRQKELLIPTLSLKKSLEIITTISDDLYKSKALTTLASKIEDDETLNELVTITYTIFDNRYKFQTLISIISMMQNIDKALEIAESIPSAKYRLEAIVSIISKTEDIDRALEVAYKISNSTYKSKALASIIYKIEDIQKALEVSNYISDAKENSNALSSIVSKIKSIEDTKEALEITNNISNEGYKLEALVSIASNCKDYKEALSIANSISNDWYKAEALLSTVLKIENREEALEVAYSISSIKHRVEALTYISIKTEDSKLLTQAVDIALNEVNTLSKAEALSSIALQLNEKEKALEIVKSISDSNYRVETLLSIALQTEDNELFKDILEMLYRSSNDEYKSKIISSIVSNTEAKEIFHKAIEVTKTISDIHYQNEIFKSILLRVGDLVDIVEALEVASYIFNNTYKIEAIVTIVSKVEDRAMFTQALKIVNSISHNRYKSEALASIASNVEDVERALEITENISNNEYRYKALKNIVSKTEDRQKALEIANSISNAQYKSKILSSIVENLDDVESALKITATISDDLQKSQLLASILLKVENKERAVEIVNDISDESARAELLISIVTDSEDFKSIQNILPITENFLNDRYKAEVLKSLVAIVQDKEHFKQLLKLTDTLSSHEYKEEILATITSKIEKIQNIDDAIDITNSISLNEHKYKTLTAIVSSIEDSDKALKIASTIFDPRYNSKALASIAVKMQDYTKALHILKSISEDKYRVETLVSIVSKKADEESFKEALNIAKSISDEWYKLEILSSIIVKTEDLTTLRQVLELIHHISNPRYKAEALILITSKVEDSEMLSQIIVIANTLSNDRYKSQTLASIVSKTENLEKAFNILATISDEEYKLEALTTIVTKIKDKESFNKILEIADTLSSDEYKSTALSTIAIKTHESSIFKQALKKIGTVSDDLHKSNSISHIVSNKKSEESLELSMKLAKSISSDWYRSKALSKIVEYISNKERALEVTYTISAPSYRAIAFISIAMQTQKIKMLKLAVEEVNSIVEDRFKSELLISIASQTDNNEVLKLAVEVSKSISDDWYKSQTLLSITTQTHSSEIFNLTLEVIQTISDEKYISKFILSTVERSENFKQILNLISDISDDRYKVESLTPIVLQSENSEILKLAIKIANSISTLRYKTELFSSIVSKLENLKDLKKVLELTDTILDDRYRASALTSIVSKTDDVKVFKQIFVTLNRMADTSYKEEVLNAVLSTIKEMQSKENALQITSNIVNEKYKVEALRDIISKVSQEEILKKVFYQILNINTSQKISSIKILDDKLPSIKKQGILYSQFFNDEITILETIPVITELSSDDILNYYGIKVDRDTEATLEPFIEEFKKLSSSELPKREKRDNFHDIKEKIAQDKSLLSEFIQRFGELLEIEDEDDFEEEFTLKDIESILE